MHRVARQHQTVASAKHATNTEEWWEHRPGDRVRTIDGPGRVTAVNDGPFPGAEEYHVELDGGLGGGAYQPGQITKMLPTMASTEHTADWDYPELGTLLYDRPDPAKMTYTASYTPDVPGANGTQGPFESEYTLPHVYARDIHSGAGNCVCGAGLEDDLHTEAAPGVSLHREAVGNYTDYEDPHKVYLRFGDWPENERSRNNVTGHSEEGVSVYDLNEHGEPEDPDAGMNRYHVHDEHCEGDCDLDQWNDEYDNDTREEMNGRVRQAERSRYQGRDNPGDSAHLVKGTMVGIGHDGEPLLNNVRRVGDWIDHRHLFFPKATPHRLARDPHEEDYEPPVLGKHADLMGSGDPGDSMTPGATVSDEGNDNGSWPPEYNNALYHRKDVPATTHVSHLIFSPYQQGDDEGAIAQHLREHHGYSNDQLQRLQNNRVDDDPMRGEHEAEHEASTYDEGVGGTEFGMGEAESRTPHTHEHDKHSGGGRWIQDTEMIPSGPGFFSLSSLPSVEAISDDRRKELRDQATDPKHYKELLRGEIAKERDKKQRTDEFLDEKFGPEMPIPRRYHPAWGGSTPQDDLFGRMVSTEEGVSQDVEDARADRQSLHSLNHLLVTASLDPEFRFHFTAAWADVRAKAKRIRAEGGVNITHADDMMVIGNVRGDHHVYESGLQRHPGRRSSVAVYSCGCKWGAYHWGAPDDLSRFAGRMCSHALALQYEAASRGMFGHDVEVDAAPAKWVPSRVVVKYDIDDRDNLYARAALRGVPQQAPHLVVVASLEDGDLFLPSIVAATNELFGGGVVESNPTNMNIYGPTVAPNPDESPASAGPFSGGEPNNWGSITTNMLARTRIASAMQAEGFWRRLAESLMGEEGAEATLHDEPQGALPETDGHVHLATPDEARDEDYTPEERDLDPLVASLGDVELTEHTPDAADTEPDYQSIQTQGADLGGGGGIGSIEGLDPEEMGEPEMINTLDRVGSVSDIVAEFQKSAGAQALRGKGTASSPSTGGKFDDIAGAAEAYLTKTAASFSAAERQELINESPGTQASNTDRLDIEGTHYALLEDEPDDVGWLD